MQDGAPGVISRRRLGACGRPGSRSWPIQSWPIQSWPIQSWPIQLLASAHWPSHPTPPGPLGTPGPPGTPGAPAVPGTSVAHRNQVQRGRHTGKNGMARDRQLELGQRLGRSRFKVQQ